MPSPCASRAWALRPHWWNPWNASERWKKSTRQCGVSFFSLSVWHQNCSVTYSHTYDQEKEIMIEPSKNKGAINLVDRKLKLVKKIFFKSILHYFSDQCINKTVRSHVCAISPVCQLLSITHLFFWQWGGGRGRGLSPIMQWSFILIHLLVTFYLYPTALHFKVYSCIPAILPPCLEITKFVRKDIKFQWSISQSIMQALLTKTSLK